MDVIYIGTQGTPTTQQGVETDRDRALEHMKKILRETPGHIYKVGITSNPPKRASAHHNMTPVDEREEGDDLVIVTYQKGLWSKMYVIFQTPLFGEIARAEKSFIEAADKSFAADFNASNLVTMNVASGGEGSRRSTGPYFLYLLRSVG